MTEWTELDWLRIGSIGDGSQPSVSVKYDKCPRRLSDYQIPNDSLIPDVGNYTCSTLFVSQ